VQRTQNLFDYIFGILVVCLCLGCRGGPSFANDGAYRSIEQEVSQKNKKRNYRIILTALIVLMTLTASCQNAPPKIEYIREVPDIVFPVFPPPDCVSFDPETEIVSMPLWYWQDIAEYKLDIDALEEYLSRLRNIENAVEDNEK
jgi:hypothetical protein